MPPATRFSEQIKLLLSSLPQRKRIALLLLVGGVIAAFIYLIIWAGQPEFQVLYSNLSPQDAGQIIAKLKEKKIPYQVSPVGNSISVPTDKVYELRLNLASQGLPEGSAIGFEVFDNTKLGMTEFVQNINYQRALQGELSRTINSFTEVESSRVHIVMPKESLFIEKEQPATTSVFLKLKPGSTLSKTQIQGIVHLISASVPGLNPENVTVVDNHGKMLAGFKEESDLAGLTSSQLEFQEKVERGLERKIKSMLEKVLGVGKAVVKVSALIDFKKVERHEEKYDPGNKVVRSEQILTESSNGGEIIPVGIPGVASNTTTQGEEKVSQTDRTFQKQDRTVNYEIGKVVSSEVEPIGKIKRLSIAVVVDGTYKLVKEQKGVKGKKKLAEDWKYVPRSEVEMEKIESIVKSAVNFDPTRGDQIEVVNIPFETKELKRNGGEQKEETSFFSFSRLNPLWPLIRYFFLAIFLILSFIFVVKPIVHWLTLSPTGDLELLKQLPLTVGEIERQYGGEGSLPFKDQILELMTKDKEKSIKLLEEWLKDK
ncbi:MAG: flagellar M-ring protein FliF [Deltaproteobacteria bacterium]|nr:MAG: flagellar M-ring protein FliF [Deltaproteobacteria bacterium]